MRYPPNDGTMEHLCGARFHERFPFVAFASAQAVGLIGLCGTPRIALEGAGERWSGGAVDRLID